MHVYNSLTRKLEPFEPLEEGKVIMYVCGLTPYDSAHIGHARTYVAFDLLKRHLLSKGYEVFHIQNITDVEDKIIKRCMESGADPGVLTRENHERALELFSRLNILKADEYPKVTGHIGPILDLIKKLIEAGHAYETATGIYYAVSSFPGYGKLSGQDMEQIEAGSRFEVDETKKDPADFALWKKSKGEILEFDSPWGRGRPGWHIECSAMACKYAGRPLDIHGGGRDLIFPHHENEIAQSEGAGCVPYCRYWMHPGFLSVGGEKMSKSLGNFVTLEDALKAVSPNALRLFFIQAHYRSPLDYEPDKIASMEEAVERIFNALGLIRESSIGIGTEDKAFREASRDLVLSFRRHMDDDLKTPEALSSLYGLLRLCNSHIAGGKADSARLSELSKDIESMLSVLGLKEPERASLSSKEEGLKALLTDLGARAEGDAGKMMEALISLRAQARQGKDFKKADLIRSRLSDLGIVLEDSDKGARWKTKD